MANDMGKKLRELRDNRGLTQREVANAVGVTEATVSRWESGHINNMRRDKIEKLAKVLQVSPLVIMGRDAESAPPAFPPRPPSRTARSSPSETRSPSPNGSTSSSTANSTNEAATPWMT